MWVSRDTLDRNRLLTDDEYIEAVRKICDFLEIDYYTEGAEIPEDAAKQRYDTKTLQIINQDAD